MGGNVTTAEDLDKYTTTTSLYGFKLHLCLTSRSNTKLVSEDVASVFAIKFPKNIREVRRLLGMIQYYQDLWEKEVIFLAL